MKSTGIPPDILLPGTIYNNIIRHIKGRVLDIGTGDGHKLKNIIKGSDFNKLKQVVAIEPSPLYKKARENLKDLKKLEIINVAVEDIGIVGEGGANNLPELKENFFDVILMFDVIEHLKDQSRAIEKIIKLLKPEGIFICSTPNKFIYHLTAFLKGEKTESTHISELTYGEFISLINLYFDKRYYLGFLPWMALFKKFPRLDILNKIFPFLFISRTIYAFAGKPKR